jgi:hypothetical protein
MCWSSQGCNLQPRSGSIEISVSVGMNEASLPVGLDRHTQHGPFFIEFVTTRKKTKLADQIV